MDVLKNKIIEYLPQGDKYYPDEQITDKDINFQVSELIREKAIELTREEIPHSIAVLIEQIFPKKNKDKEIIYIRACIYVERDSQKAIVIGHKGSMIKQIGTLARADIEGLFKKQIFLGLWVKVLKNWRNDSRALKMLGLD